MRVCVFRDADRSSGDRQSLRGEERNIDAYRISALEAALVSDDDRHQDALSLRLHRPAAYHQEEKVRPVSSILSDLHSDDASELSRIAFLYMIAPYCHITYYHITILSQYRYYYFSPSVVRSRGLKT